MSVINHRALLGQAQLRSAKIFRQLLLHQGDLLQELQVPGHLIEERLGQLVHQSDESLRWWRLDDEVKGLLINSWIFLSFPDFGGFLLPRSLGADGHLDHSL